VVDHNRQFEPFEDPGFEPSQLESELRQALQPRSAPPDFAARVMGQIPADTHPEAAPAPRRARIFRFPAPARLAAVASLFIVVLAGTLAWQQHQRRVAGERARRQVFTALQITHATLQQVAENISTIQTRKDLQP
jgi:uracil-DNA glycosylase